MKTPYRYLLLMLLLLGLQLPVEAQGGRWVSLDGGGEERSLSRSTKKKRKVRQKLSTGKEKEQQVSVVPPRTDFSRLNVKGRPVERNYRQREYKAYYSLDDMRRLYKISHYSSFENPTGILFRKGEEARFHVSANAPANRLFLVLKDWGEQGRTSRIPLRAGSNQITIPQDGLAYIDYRDANPDTAPAVSIGISGGTINGVFTQHDNALTWKHILEKAQGAGLDMVGERVQLLFRVESLRKHCPAKGPELLRLYDDIVREEQTIMAWDRDGVHPGNHVMGHFSWHGYMFAGGLGAGFHYDTSGTTNNPDNMRNSGAWGVAHEFGHINQVRPGLLWAGTGEVTNNIYSAWVNYCLNPNNLRLEHENCPTLDGKHLRGGRFDCYVNAAIVRRELWQFQSGPDSGVDKVPNDHPGDHFVSVCPFWQLMLYMRVVLGNEDFYPHIYSEVRKADDSKLTHGEMRVRFFKLACDAAQLNLSRFFTEIGFLAYMNRWVKDYGSVHMTITKEMCMEAMAHAARYPEPETDVIYYINGNNAHIFKEKAKVVKGPRFQPDAATGKFTIPAESWKNAVAFEVYGGEDELLRVCLLGLGHQDNLSTEIICPPGAKCVKAVQWDGKRYVVGQF